ncbi:FecR family protein [Chitinophaga polysaccharea]|uniref:FecR family protein n=1 Tax=Chitinophaga polysaccharea TaxID=1293035 RepID=A0A561PRI6_9BACT|nr:FecR domain-containing protein [Chitinophaga polysaccharea]TWF40726.1 FecR family protein [Chitinophaga polysaccharea]
MDTPGKDINWDKLLDALENADTASLNEEEQAMLRAASEMKSRVQSADKFPTEEGWQRFVAARDNRPLKVSWRKRVAVAAAVTALVAGTGWWWQHHRSTGKSSGLMAKADLKPSVRPQIHLSNGKIMTLDSAGTAVQNVNGTAIRANNSEVIYEGSNGAATPQQDTLVVPRGNTIRVVLSDGTKVCVNAESELVYPSGFNGLKREVQVKGEAFFEVAANPQQPFIVHAKGVAINVLGTAFNVNTYTVSIQTTLTSGKVSTVADGQNVVLSPGQQSIYNSQTKTLQQQTVDTRIFTAWKDGDIYFEETSLSTILNSLGRSFDYEFKFEDASLEKLSFTLDMRTPEDLQQVLDRISLTNGDVKFRVQGRTIYVRRSGQTGK